MQHLVGQNSSKELDEQEFMMAMLKSWEEGKAEARADDLPTVLRVRGIVVSDAARERILAQKDQKELKRWLEKAAIASSIDEVIDNPS